MLNSDRYSIYRLINPSHGFPLYLSMSIDRHIKRIVTKFRFGLSDLRKNRFYYKQVDANDLLCPLCNMDVDDELHFTLVCQYLSPLRRNFIANKYFNQPCLFKLIMLLASENEDVVKQFAVYLYKAFKLRDVLVDQQFLTLYRMIYYCMLPPSNVAKAF